MATDAKKDMQGIIITILVTLAVVLLGVIANYQYRMVNQVDNVVIEFRQMRVEVDYQKKEVERQGAVLINHDNRLYRVERKTGIQDARSNY